MRNERPFHRMNQQHFSKRSPMERRAMFSQMRDPDCAMVMCDNDHFPPSRNHECSRFEVAVWMQQNPDRC